MISARSFHLSGSVWYLNEEASTNKLNRAIVKNLEAKYEKYLEEVLHRNIVQVLIVRESNEIMMVMNIY